METESIEDRNCSPETIVFYAAKEAVFMESDTTEAALNSYLLEKAKPGSSHTGHYLFSFDFVYVSNHNVRNYLYW